MDNKSFNKYFRLNPLLIENTFHGGAYPLLVCLPILLLVDVIDDPVPAGFERSLASESMNLHRYL